MNRVCASKNCVMKRRRARESKQRKYSGVGSDVSKWTVKNIPNLMAARVGHGEFMSPSKFLEEQSSFQAKWDRILSSSQTQAPSITEELIVLNPNDVLEGAIHKKHAEIVQKVNLSEDGTKYKEAISREQAIDAVLPNPIRRPPQEQQKEFIRKFVRSSAQMRHFEIRRVNSLSRQTLLERVNSVPEFQPIAERELIIRVALLEASSHDPHTSQEILMLGSQTLADLRDVLKCRTASCFKAHDPTIPNSAYFLIEDTFYDDTRGNAPRYSDSIIEWSGHKDRTITTLSTYRQAEMHNTRLMDIQPGLRVNSLYSFCHLGSCSHVMTFTEMRLKRDDDVQNSLCYPLQAYEPKSKRRKCGVCMLYAARWALYDDRLACDNPYFLCDMCEDQLHNDSDGNPLYSDYTKFPYMQDH